MKTRYVLNTQTGVVLFRNAATDDNPFVFRLIDDETAAAINSREIDVRDVVEAVLKSDHEKDGFSYTAYDAQRKAAIKKLNMSERTMVPISEMPDKPEEKQDNPDDVITLEKVKPSRRGRTQKAKSANVNEPKEEQPRSAALADLGI